MRFVRLRLPGASDRDEEADGVAVRCVRDERRDRPIDAPSSSTPEVPGVFARRDGKCAKQARPPRQGVISSYDEEKTLKMMPVFSRQCQKEARSED